MRTPPLLLGAALLFWGWQTDYLPAAVLMAAGLEASRWLKARWELADKDLNQLWDFSILLFLGSAVYAFTANEGAATLGGFFTADSFTARSEMMSKGEQIAMNFFRWLPMLFFPIMAAQAYGQRDTMDLSVFSLWLRRQRRRNEQTGQKPAPGPGLNLAYPYFSIVLFSACSSNTQTPWFYVGLSVLLTWTLWQERPQRYPLAAWAAVLLVAAGLGYAGQLGLRQLQSLVERVPAGWFARFGRKGFDPRESRTRLGEIGKLKSSGSIALRVAVPPGQHPPTLLRQSAYNLFRSPTWGSSIKSFNPMVADNNQTTWTLLPKAQPDRVVEVAAYVPDGRGLLTLPTGVARVDRLQSFLVSTNHLGSVRSDAGPGLVIYQAAYGTNATFDGAPDADDLNIPTNELPALVEVASVLQLAGAPLAETLARIERFFQQKFAYSLEQTEDGAPPANATALHRFLLQTRSGHCEYFATATVLLLRQAGIPARYAVGYVLQEGAGANRYVARDRDAHAWTLYYDRAAGCWRDFDTTPGAWLSDASQRPSWFQPLTDAWSRLWFEFQRLRWGQSGLRKYLGWVILAAVILVALRFLLQKSWKRRREKHRAATAAPTWPGGDSAFFEIEQWLTRTGLERRPGETLSAWLARIERHLPTDAALLRPILRLHYQLRFDPQGLDEAGQAELRRRAQEWLQQARATPSTQGR